MTFDTPHGTHGARQPSANAASRLVNGRIVKKIRAKGGRGIMGMNTLVLTTIGAKSGRERTTPVAWFPSEDGTWVITASAGGATGNPAWYHNLAAHPDRVRIEVDGETIDAVAEQLHGDERERAWAAIVAAVPKFKGYETATDRQIPVIRLRRRTT